MAKPIVAAAVQMTSTAEAERNLETAERLVEAAAARGAQLVGLPENFAFLRSEGEPVPEAQSLDGPWVRRMAEVAHGEGIALAELDFDRQDRIRRELPALGHVRL